MNAKKIRKLTNTVLSLGVATSIIVSPYLQKKDVPYTATDISNNSTFIKELTTIEETYNIEFKNEEIYSIIAEELGRDFTIKDLRNIKGLSIKNLQNTDLTDLKYLINLESLTIQGSNIDCSYLRYNQNLKKLDLVDSTITNTEQLPNSINKMQCLDIIVDDGILYIPYNTIDFRVNGSFFTNLYFKNPSNLSIFSYESFSILDLKEIESCTNLVTCNLSYCPNIKNPSILTNLPNLTYLYLDDYAPIWLDKYTLNSLSCVDEETKNHLMPIIRELDRTAEALVPFEMPDAEKVRSICLNVAYRIDYDYSVTSSEEMINEISKDYNSLPLTYALKGNGVCINYACMFKALANRVGLENYQDASVDHTWNTVEINEQYTSFDVTNLDDDRAIITDANGDPIRHPSKGYQAFFDGHEEYRLYFYDFNSNEVDDFDETYESNVQLPQENIDKNIGYVKNTYPQSIIERKNIRIDTLKRLHPVLPIGIILNILLTIIDKKQRKIKKLTK